jgi:hypothetical protein
MPKLPDEIRIMTGTDGSAKAIYIDGEEFPWHVTDQVNVYLNPPMSTLTVTIPANRIIVNDGGTPHRVIKDQPQA